MSRAKRTRREEQDRRKHDEDLRITMAELREIMVDTVERHRLAEDEERERRGKRA